MSTREIVVSMLDNLTEEQLQGLILFIKNYEKKDETTAESVRGILSGYADKNLIDKEKGAWERAVLEKYEDA